MARTPFKLKSGNKVSFKEMGKTPVKQVTPDYTSDDLLGSEYTPSASSQNDKLLEQRYREERAEKQREAVASVPTRKERRKANVAALEAQTGKKMVEGEDYKTKAQLRQEKKTRNVKRRQETERGSDARKQRRKEDRDKTLKDRLAREKGTGKSKVTFNIRKAILGGSSAAGVGHRPAHEATQEKIDKRNRREEAKKTREVERKKRKSLRSK